MKTSASLFVLAIAALATSAQAALVEWTFQADVRDITGNSEGLEDYGITHGSVLSATYLFDTDAKAYEIGDGYYTNAALVGISISAGIFEASLDPATAGGNPADFHDGAFDAVYMVAIMVIENGTNSTQGALSTQFISSDGLLIDNVLFPWLPDFEHVDDYDPNHTPQSGTYLEFQIPIDGMMAVFDAEISSPSARIVPVPAAVWFMLSGLGVLLGFGSRK